jgi:hypothetical protein
MGRRYTIWHLHFGRLLIERGVRGIEVRFEVPLGTEPQRMDYLLVHATDDIDPDTARSLLGLWRHLRREMIIEFKSVSRDYARRDIDRLVGYGLQHWCASTDTLTRRSDLTLALIVPSWTQLLVDDLDSLGWVVTPLGGGYSSVAGAPFPLVIVDLDVVAEEEHDLLVGSFGHRRNDTAEVRAWWLAERGASVMGMKDEDVKELEGYDELERRFLASVPIERRLDGIPTEERLAGIPTEERLAGIPTEERLAGIPPEERWLALTDEELRMLPEALVASLPPAVQSRIRERLTR